MNAHVPSQRSPSAARAGSGDALPAPSPMAPRFFHAPPSAPPDEAALATWWHRFLDPELDRLVEATLGQGHAMSAAGVRLRQACEHAGPARGCASGIDIDIDPGIDAGIDADAHGEAVALYAFYDVRLREIATTARHYFIALTLGDRIACADAAIALETGLLRGAGAAKARDASTGRGDPPRPAMLADLHALRIRLRAQWDGALVALAYQAAQPLSVLVPRLAGRCLPGACAATPALGGPDRLRLRRPDVLAEAERERLCARRSQAQPDGDRGAAQLAALACEQRHDRAVSEVEAALSTLAALQAELVPLRAAAAMAEARFERARREAAPHVVLDAARVLHALHDREIETRGRGYLALVDLFHAAGCGWPILSDPEFPA